MNLLMLIGSAFAADHIDGDTAAADPAADLTDLFAWHDDSKVYVAVNFAGAGSTIDSGMYDADVLYGVHIDLDGDYDNGAETDIWIRFGQDSQGNWGVQVENLPGAGAPVVGPVEAVVAAPGGKVFAGVRNDPFFFDFAGFNDTIATGDVAFTGADFFAGLNVTSIVLEMDRNAAAEGADGLAVWATSARITASI